MNDSKHLKILVVYSLAVPERSDAATRGRAERNRAQRIHLLESGCNITLNCAKSRSVCWIWQICLSDRPVLMQRTALVRDLQKTQPVITPQGWHTTCRARSGANGGI